MTLMDHITRIVTLLRAAIGAQLTRQLRPPQPVLLGQRVYLPLIPPPRHRLLPQPVWSLLDLRLGRLLRRFQALYDGWRAGTLAPPRPRREAGPRPARPAPALRLPRGFAWVNHRIPEAAPPAGFLEHILHNEPEARRFLAEVPRAGRLLRPLCQALGLRAPSWLSLPPAPRRVRAARPRPPRRCSLSDPRLALPANVIAAARHARKSTPTG